MRPLTLLRLLCEGAAGTVGLELPSRPKVDATWNAAHAMRKKVTRKMLQRNPLALLLQVLLPMVLKRKEKGHVPLGDGGCPGGLRCWMLAGGLCVSKLTWTAKDGSF